MEQRNGSCILAVLGSGSDTDSVSCLRGGRSNGTERRQFYRPGERGFEREIKKRLEYWEKLRQRAAGTE